MGPTHLHWSLQLYCVQSPSYTTKLLPALTTMGAAANIKLASLSKPPGRTKPKNQAQRKNIQALVNKKVENHN